MNFCVVALSVVGLVNDFLFAVIIIASLTAVVLLLVFIFILNINPVSVSAGYAKESAITPNMPVRVCPQSFLCCF